MTFKISTIVDECRDDALLKEKKQMLHMWINTGIALGALIAALIK